jgi:hypothetical protein
MGSSGGGDYEEPPRGPSPPASMIAPQGQSAPFNPHFINFLGDPSQPSTGLTPGMLQEIGAMNGPPGGPPGASAGGAVDSQISDLRNQLAAMQAGPSQAEKNRDYMQHWRDRDRGSGGQRGGSAGGGGWGGH